MAGAKPGVHHVQLKSVLVSESLIAGAKFIKWDDSSQTGTPVTLRVDKNGHILFWRNQNKEMDFLDILLIRDARQGKHAKVPKDGKLRDTLMIGQQDIPLEEKTVSVCFGTDFVNVEWINFVSSHRDTAKEWADNIFKYSRNLLALNASALTFLEKSYTRLSVVLNQDGKIPIKNVQKMVAVNREDRKKVESSLEAAGFHTGKNGNIDPHKLSFEQYFNFYRHLTGRTEVDKIFDEIGAKKKPYLTVEQFQDFLNKHQRDPRLNEILYPFYTKDQAQALIDTYETKQGMAAKGHLSQEGFLKFLMSEENNLIPPEKLDLSEDMAQPLSHYFINSSHNTYLTGHQLTGKSSVEVYCQVLLAGCRCVELDCWDGRGADEEPIITHGFTMCTEIPFKDVIEAIALCAFKTSEYPLILSFENHCSPRQQAKMANYCKEIFGDMLLTSTIEDHPLESDVPLPSPDQLKRKLLVKNKKQHVHHRHSHPPKQGTPSKSSTKSSGESKQKVSITESDKGSDKSSTIEGGTTLEKTSNSLPSSPEKRVEKSPVCGEGEKSEISVVKAVAVGDELLNDSESESSDDEDDVALDIMSEEEKYRRQREKRERGTAGKEAEAASEMSELVNYIMPVHFHSFEVAEKRKRFYEISSFVETQGTALLKEFPVEFVNYNKYQLSRIYPRGTRVDSSNFMPQVFWNAGCQLVALNFQTLDLAMQINLGIFEYNKQCGYILKPDFMRRSDRHFDPFAESTVDGIVAGTVSVRVISAQFLSDKKVSTYVEVDMYGLPTDTFRKKFKTKTIPANGINPVYDEDAFVFKKIVLPNLATLRIGVFEETGKLIGHRVLPVEGLRPGYRHIPLRNENNQPMLLPTLFVHIVVNDYVSDIHQEFARALENPTAWLSAQEKHAQQIAVLVDDFGFDEEIDNADKMQQRQDSIINRQPHNGNLSSSDSQRLTRAQSASVKERPLSKQDSSQSAGNSSSTGPHTITRMQSNLSGVENGTSGLSVISVAQTTKLNDPELLKPTPLSDLKKHKQIQKALANREKDLQSIRRKRDKVHESLVETFSLKLEKQAYQQLKQRTSLEKSHSKLMKKVSKSQQQVKVDEAETKYQSDLQDLVNQQQEKHKELKQSHAQILVAKNIDLYCAEMNIYIRHHEHIYGVLQNLMIANHSQHKQQLMQLYDREVFELKKRMDQQSRDHMKTLARKHKDKSELSRIKREVQTKHVFLAVQERQRLKDILEKRQEELEEKLNEVAKELEKEKEMVLVSYSEEFNEKCKKIKEEYKDLLPKSFDEEEDVCPAIPQKSSPSKSSPVKSSFSDSEKTSPMHQPAQTADEKTSETESPVHLPDSDEKNTFPEKTSPEVEEKTIPDKDSYVNANKINSQEQLTAM
ncbi:1-phosphatidylinositol 4,5-bisphosphate phosphodiesterase beta-1-like [Gigantopelta aegis]|uniref:1-phosphatidylinositol 4,5-bisphosphate phosphodiesterase beta-1-like n=1 Tax=Gigantopelta aegis TaxID=1735272 RepID=UPI001B888113|nr:1-phosphatidylinositol 4,5-bisphosphate phosphodiesterase beta-1-like [Gigantopelta aegis]